MTATGDVLAGRYRLVNRVATGGMGSVWEAWDELLQRPVAIKELLPQPGLSRDDAAMARSRVIREARITARLHHRNAVTLFDVIEHQQQPCLILQFVTSRTLNSILAEQGLLQVPFVTGVGAEVASALAAAHQVGIIHRDVKPSNILITPDGTAMITDFGISHAAGDVSLTLTGMVTGTPAFLAPEVARGAPSGFPADVFSLGATLYAALEGTPPFGTDQNAMAILHKVAGGQILPPRRSGALTALLGQMLATDPAARPAMATVARILTDLQSQDPAAAPDPQSATAALPPQTITVPPRTVREWRTGPGHGGVPSFAVRPAEGAPQTAPTDDRHRRQLGVVLAAVMVLLLAGLGAWALLGRSSNTHPAAGTNAANVPESATRSAGPTAITQRTSLPSTSAPAETTRARTTSPPLRPIPVAPSSTSPSTTATTGSSVSTSRTTTPSTPTTSRTAGTTPSSTPSTTVQAVPTATQLAAAISNYYALLPSSTDQGWAHLTSNFQTGTAQNRQYYQRFWDSIQSVTATNTHGASPDTAEATITYRFKDGRTAVEPTVYSLIQQGGVLKIDSSTVLSSTTQ